MTAFDYVVLAIVFVSIAISVLRGLVKEVVSLIAWVAAFVVASRYGADAATLLPDAVPDGIARLMTGFAILFVGVLFAGALVNWAIARIIAVSGLRIVDRGLGGLFGLARGVLIVVTLAMLAGLTELPRQPAWRDALLAPLVETVSHTVEPWLPQRWADRIRFRSNA